MRMCRARCECVMASADPASVWVTSCLEPPGHPWEAAVGPPSWEGLAFPKSFAPHCAVTVCWGHHITLLARIPAQGCAWCIPWRDRAAVGMECLLSGEGSGRLVVSHLTSPALVTDGSCLGKAVEPREGGLGCG